ncbi:MAG: SIMPL domain-containing protein [Alteromonadaceae bacterium]|nr:SIMPL domain-containing protein [Alteromonadaceae bacterium]
MLTLGLASSALAPALTQAGELSLSGEGTVQYTPDSARLQFTAQAEHTNPDKASERVANSMARWRKAIAPYREQLTDYSDAQLSLHIRQAYPKDNNDEPETRSIARQTVSFSIGDLTLLNPLIGHAQDIGLQYNLGTHQFFHSDEDRLENQALARAITDARQRCQFAAKQFGKRCGEVVSVNLDNSYRPAPMMRAQAAEAADTVSSVGPREIRATVNATFELN